MNLVKLWDVQVRIGGEWKWAGVSPVGVRRCTANHYRARLALDPYWRSIGVDAFRVAEVAR